MYEGEVLVLWRTKYASGALSFRLIAFATSLPKGGKGTTSISIYYCIYRQKAKPRTRRGRELFKTFGVFGILAEFGNKTFWKHKEFIFKKVCHINRRGSKGTFLDCF